MALRASATEATPRQWTPCCSIHSTSAARPVGSSSTISVSSVWDMRTSGLAECGLVHARCLAAGQFDLDTEGACALRRDSHVASQTADQRLDGEPLPAGQVAVAECEGPAVNGGDHARSAGSDRQ